MNSDINSLGKPNSSDSTGGRGRRDLIAICVFAVVLVVFLTVFRYRSGDIEYWDSDATWHTLLTVRCYDEAPISQHLFLPIVTMGGEENKWISWGSTIPDSQGNYYYTSFSPIGFFLPWLFMKIFNLPLAEKSLYLFNNILFAISAVLIVMLIGAVYENNKDRNILMIISAIAYVCTPELLHGMGIVYWHQSIMQVTLLAQIYSFYLYEIKGKAGFKRLFYVLALCNPYIEWTGYVANIGFALTEIMLNWKKSKSTGLKKALLLGCITTASFGIFCGHYLLRTNASDFFKALMDRFMARNTLSETEVLVTDVLGSYFESFIYLWLLLFCVIVWIFIKNGSLKIGNGIILFVTAFPVIENIIMKQHAVAYSYDKMKAVFVLILLMCEIVINLFETYDSFKIRKIIVGFTIIAAVLNIRSYRFDELYTWKADFKNDNSKLAGFVTSEYPNALYASDIAVRGYMNFLFDRGMYEWQSIDSAIELAKEQGKENVIFITRDEEETNKLLPIQVINTATGETKVFAIEDGKVTERQK